MFELATGLIGFAIALIACMPKIHYYFAGKIRENIEKARKEWAEDVARFCVDNYKKITDSLFPN